MTFRISEKWFDFRKIDDDITLIWEPYADPLIRCNIWHIRGRDRDLLVDTGLGIASLRQAAKTLFDKPVLAVATHTHYDHIGGFHEFEDRVVHRIEAPLLEAPQDFATLRRDRLSPDFIADLEATGYVLPEFFVTAIPFKGFDIDAYEAKAAPAHRLVGDGDIIDIGRRRFEVLHLPGHSPGSIGLWEASTGILFSGDAIYDGPLLDRIPGSDIGQYVQTMHRLLRLPVRIVHGGHDPSFDRDRLHEIATAYLRANDSAFAG
jgi:glyoxylase-like metal-dependent hydrolase (beta-lactamase superfamily II)